MDKLRQAVLGSGTLQFAKSRPRLAAWLVLSASICIFVAIESRQVVLAAGQWLALFLACVVVAGLCVWIVSGEGDNGQEAGAPGTEFSLRTPGSSRPDGLMQTESDRGRTL